MLGNGFNSANHQ